MRDFLGRIKSWMARVLIGLGAIFAIYVLAGIGGSLIPANNGWSPPETGITIYVHDNGIHTGLVLPRRNAVADWSDLVRPEHLADPRYASDHLLFGWGDRVFYVETPTWGDLSPATALTALIGSEGTLVHVDHVRAPEPADNLRAITVTPEQYRRITTSIRAQFALDGNGASQPVTGYGRNDIFYEAEGRYSALRTCNEWTGSILRDAGVRVGLWTPFNFGLMRWF